MNTFYFIAFLSVFFSILVITAKNPVHSILYLVLTFFTFTIHYILMNAQFLAIVNIIVYAGAIMVLFLFVLMLMNLNAETEPQKNKYMLWSGAIAGGVLMLVLIMALQTPQSESVNLAAGDIGLIKNLGVVLFRDYAIPFELSSVLFLSAMVGAVVVGKK